MVFVLENVQSNSELFFSSFFGKSSPIEIWSDFKTLQYAADVVLVMITGNMK